MFLINIQNKCINPDQELLYFFCILTSKKDEVERVECAIQHFKDLKRHGAQRELNDQN